MAVDQDLLDRIASSVADLYREVESALVRTVAQQLRKDLPLDEQPQSLVFYQEKLDAVRKLQASARLILASLQEKRAVLIREAIAKAYRSGRDGAVADLPEKWFPKSGIGQQARQATAIVPNARVLENIAQALHRDVGRVDANILRAPLDAYRAVQAGAAARITSGAFTRREASQAAWQRLMDRGISSFTDRAGRQWRLSSYVEMLARTNAQRAAVQGQTDRLAEVGIDLVYISDNVQECKRCRPFESKVLRRDPGPVGKIRVEHATRDGVMVTVDVLDTLDGARAKGLFHPNCRHSASAYLPGVTTLKKGTADPDGDKARQKQRALERRIRAAKEAELGALTPQAKKAARARTAAAQGALRAHLKQHPKLKRLTYREQIGAGNIPRAGGPKGGPITDLTPPVQQALDTTPAPAPRPTPTPASTGRRLTPDQARAMQQRMLDGRPWTPDQRDAIERYASGWAPDMNRPLRTGSKPTPAAAKAIKDLQAAMRPLAEPVKAYRWVLPDAFGKGVRAADLAGMVGKTVQDRGFMSTSIAKDGHDNEGLARAVANLPVRIELDIPAGHPAAYVEELSANPSQWELLLGAGTKLQIVDVRQDGGQTVVRVRVVP